MRTFFSVFFSTLCKQAQKLLSKHQSHPNFGKRALTLMETRATISAWFLCFIAASLSSAGGVGGGSLYLPILNLVAGLDLKTASTFSAFMVTGGSISNVLYNLIITNHQPKSKSLIDYEIALVSEPCMLLGVSVGIVCNVMFPEWLITVLFALFLGLSTYKTFEAGFKCWRAESDEVMQLISVEDEKGILEEALLSEEEKVDDDFLGIPWKKLVVLMMVWLSFFLLHLLLADKSRQKMIQIRVCGVGYWLITLLQVPLAVGFTAYILHLIRSSQHQTLDEQKDNQVITVHTRIEALPTVVFPLSALLSGILGGLFGIGGGMLINPVLLQIGIPPQVTAATTSFMVLFSSSMSMVQYLILGMKAIKAAVAFAIVCIVASVFGLIIIQRAIEKSGRASLIIFSVSTVMALSTISMTCFGAIDVWREYNSGENLWFRPPC